MKTVRTMTGAALIIAGVLAGHAERAQLSGFRRIDLQRHELSARGSAAELATYVVEKGKPLVTVAE